MGEINILFCFIICDGLNLQRNLFSYLMLHVRHVKAVMFSDYTVQSKWSKLSFLLLISHF